MYFEVDTFAEAFSQIRTKLLEAPVISPRNMPTKELIGVTIHLKNPRSRIIYHKDRNFLLPLMVTEAIMLFSDSDRVEHLEYIAPRMKVYSDNGKTLYGAYGNRIHTNIQDILRKFQEDENTRQAVLPIIRQHDLRVVTKDFPCTQVLQLLIRDGKLHMFTTMRSNDFGWGLQYDLPVFTIFQEIIANTLNLELGEYWHTANSLHMYDYHFDLIEKMNTVESVEFSVDYTLSNMNRLIGIASSLRFMQNESEFEDTIFDFILQSFWRKKNNLPFRYVPFSQHDWSDKFLQYELKEKHDAA